MNAPKQNTLTDLLDLIDLRYTRSIVDPYNPEACENSLRDVPKLVKALREAARLYRVEVGPDSWEHKNYDSVIAQLLSESVVTQGTRVMEGAVDATPVSQKPQNILT